VGGLVGGLGFGLVGGLGLGLVVGLVVELQDHLAAIHRQESGR
jgi:hypothetical protein